MFVVLDGFYCRATDNKDNSSAVVRINVGDIIDETPVLEALHTVLIPEELPIGTSLGRFATVTDGDKGDNVTFSLYGKSKHIVLFVQMELKGNTPMMLMIMKTTQ